MMPGNKENSRGSLNVPSLTQSRTAAAKYGGGGLESSASHAIDDDSMHSLSLHSGHGLLSDRQQLPSSSHRGGLHAPGHKGGPASVDAKKKFPKPLPTNEHHEKYRYELWEGKNKFYLGGRIMLGVHSYHLMITMSLLIATYGLFMVFLVPLTGMPVLDYIAAILFAINIWTLLKTAITEPGIIPRRPPATSPEAEAAIASAARTEKGQFCHTCRIIRPPRAKHCRYCDNCVDVFDHHCPWTGTCIGVRNYSYFLAFVTVTVIGAAFCLGVSSYVIVLWAEGVHTDMVYIRDTVSPLLCSWSLIVFLLVGALFVFHLFLITRGQTTNEFLRGVKIDKDRSGCSNIFRVCCSSVPESKLLPMWERPSGEDPIHDANAHWGPAPTTKRSERAETSAAPSRYSPGLELVANPAVKFADAKRAQAPNDSRV